MNTAFYRGFVKEAFSPTAKGRIAVGLGIALAGVAVYDFFKGISLPTIGKGDLRGKGAERVDVRMWLKTLLKKKPLKRPPIVVTKYEQLEPALKGTSFSATEKLMIRRLAKHVIRTESNAFVIPDPAKDIIVIPPKIHKHVVEHELGHVRDFAEEPYKRPGMMAAVIANVWKPRYDKLIMERERRAWKHTRAKKLKEKALGSYEKGFHVGRAPVAGVGAYLGITSGIEALRRAKHAKHSSQVPRT